MRVYGLVGKSGTGKSYQAMNLCRELEIESIIDDGLFIFGNRILAGTSAKRQETKVAAIKTALFTQEEHRKSAVEKIRQIQPESILVIGTSRKMIHRIIERLELQDLSEMIEIESITTEKEREVARKQRQELGKHIIPVPTFQLKREFSGYFLDAMRIFKGLGGGKASFLEKSVVRPTFSYLGEYSISDKVIADIVIHLGNEIDGIAAIQRVISENKSSGMRITVLILAKFGVRITDAAAELQNAVAEGVEAMTAFNIKSVDIEVKGIK